MTKARISSRVTVLKMLDKETMPEGKVIDKKEGNGFHRLYIT